MQQGKKCCLLLLAVLGWFAVAVQLYLAIMNRQITMGEIIIRFFSYFTVLGNILVAACSTWLLLRPGPGAFARASTQGAIAVYIAVVGLVYNVILRFLWAPQGLQWLVDELLHSVQPALFILYWLLFAPKNELTYMLIPKWLLFPAGYLLYTLAHGAAGGFYPYPFIDVTQLGYTIVLRNAAVMLVLFVAISAAVIATGKFLEKRRTLRSYP